MVQEIVVTQLVVVLVVLVAVVESLPVPRVLQVLVLLGKDMLVVLDAVHLQQTLEPVVVVQEQWAVMVTV